MRVLLLPCIAFGLAAQDPLNDILERTRLTSARPEDRLAVRSATRTATFLGRAPAAITVITREDIQRYGYQTLDQALARVAEVHTHDLGHNTDADFRGFFANNTQRRVLYLLDGQALNDRFHFGDFLPDTVQDLSEVERIEVLRGPGSALYGTSAVLGVVNIVTRQALDRPLGKHLAGRLSTEVPQAGGSRQAAVVSFQHRWSLTGGLSLRMSATHGALRHDTGTGSLPRPWTSPFEAGGPGWATRREGQDVYWAVPGTFTSGTSFVRGRNLPDLDLQLHVGDIALRATSLSHRTSWVWFQGGSTFNHPDNERSWGVTLLSATWAPLRSGRVHPMVRLGLTRHTNREIMDYGAEVQGLKADGTPSGTSLFQARMLEAHLPLVTWDATGSTYGLGAGIDPFLATDAEAQRHGGGGRKNYAGIGRTSFLEAQVTAYVREGLELSAGGVMERSTYANLQWSSFRDSTFIGWLRTGGLSDDGGRSALWTQTIWEATPRLTVTAGLRYDRQHIDRVRRQLGDGPTVFEPLAGGLRALDRRDVVSEDLTPRLALTWRLGTGRTLRLLYSEAFRAVPPQEVMRLPRDYGDARSEKTRSAEVLFTTPLPGGLQASASAFHLRGNVLYAFFQGSAFAFSAGSGWSNTGLTLEARFRPSDHFEAWSNASVYRLRRPTDTHSFMVDHQVPPPFPALPNQPRPLDSPTLLAKAGLSVTWTPGRTLALQALAQGPTQSLRPVDLNVGDPAPTMPGSPDFKIHHTPGGLRLDATFRTPLGRKGFLMLGLRNLLDAPAWGVLPMEAQGWSPQTYVRPMQFKGPGRSLVIQVGSSL